MNYKEAIEWISGFQKHGIKLGLERITYICKKIGNPQNNYKIIHIGGTNGKGSVCKFIGSILTKAGYDVGIYTSPHLQRFSERFVINNKEISESEIINLVEIIKPIVNEMIGKENNPTYFEIVTTMAFQYFSSQKVDYAIIEVGLGGRFDATNIVKPSLTIITNVSLEHQDVLGENISKIASEKAGIIKKDIPIITAAKDDAFQIIKEKSKKKKSPLILIDDNIWKKIGKQDFVIHGLLKDYYIKSKMFGNFLGENIAISIIAIEKLQMNGVFITDDNIIEGIFNAESPGRMEIYSTYPRIILDGAHNISAMKALKETIESDFKYEKLILIIGILKDKSINEMLNIIIPITDVVITTKSDNIRAIDPSLLKEKIKKINPRKNIFSFNEIEKAIDYANNLVKEEDLILITGSLFTVGNAKDYLIKNKQKC